MKRTRQHLSTAAMALAAIPLFAGSGVANAADTTIDLSATKQLIRGFGASSAWNGTISTAIMDALYKTLGYTILRVRIEENIGDGWSSGNFNSWAPELANAKNAIARGAIVFASPWNPPASMKSGGKLITSKYADYANYLKAYVKYFADNNASLFAISIQNEPDYAQDWTAWTATDLLNFLKQEGAGLSAVMKVMMPESFQFRHEMSDPSVNDATVSKYISIIGGHLYGGKIQTYPAATDKGMELWETEHYFDDDSISNIMKLGKEIHDCMVTASMNAYVYWWIVQGNGLANSGGTIFKRAYALGQFAKYIRPGYHRVDATAAPATGVSVSAYAGEGKVVIVAVNTGSAAANQNFVIKGGSVSQVSSWQTTSSSNMAAGQNYPVSGGAFTAALSAQSITTFVGDLSGYVAPDGGAPVPVADAAPVGKDARDASGGGGSGGSSGTGSGGAGASGGKPGSGGVGGTGGVPSAAGASAGSSGSGGASSSASVGGGPVAGSSASSSGGAQSSSSQAHSSAGPSSSSSAGSQGGSSGNASTGSGVVGGSSNGCSCALASRDAHNLGRGFGLVLVIGGVIVARRRARAR
jgi:glucuronoarabinoxylan endo-1,4-beta-xylanase